jgi:adenine-specific DNA-methyltransferase
LNFSETISNLYDDILNSKDSICKIDNIKRCKYFLGLKESDSIGDYYYKNINVNKNGVVYTPLNIVLLMMQNTFKDEIIRNPFLKILDPSCGSGNILMGIFGYLKCIYIENLDTINKIHNLDLKESTVNKHIIDNNLYGIDIDEMALKILSIELFYKAGYINIKNFTCKDFLTSETDEKFHIIIGNPPYIGTKALNKDYSNILRKLYSDVFNDKGDISYCFFVKALKSVYPDYKITFITSRYFMESLSGSKLRKFLINSSGIHRIVDFYGIRPFRGAGIDPVIIYLSKDTPMDIIVNKPIVEEKQKSLIDGNSYNTFFVKRESLNQEPWRLQRKEYLDIVEKIEKRCSKRLGELCDSYQGIISGLDKAFIVNDEIVEEYNIEKGLLKPWIKNSNITKSGIIKNKQFLIYSNIITSEDEYPNAIKYIGLYKEKLIKRRECAMGKRKWYELQWGREKSVFEREKIIFPYKCDENRFVMDYNNYFSADIYALNIKNEVYVNHNFLQSILNSTLYELYFKCFAKKLGGKLYEYYPNNLNRLYIPTDKYDAFKSEEELFDFFNLSMKDVEYIKALKG